LSTCVRLIYEGLNKGTNAVKGIIIENSDAIFNSGYEGVFILLKSYLTVIKDVTERSIRDLNLISKTIDVLASVQNYYVVKGWKIKCIGQKLTFDAFELRDFAKGIYLKLCASKVDPQSKAAAVEIVKKSVCAITVLVYEELSREEGEVAFIKECLKGLTNTLEAHSVEDIKKVCL